MMAAEHHYVYTGDGNPPQNATHVSIHESITVIPEELFSEHPNIIELICHSFVRKIEEYAFYCCPRLKRMIVPGVEEIEGAAFMECAALAQIEGKKLEIIRRHAFCDCKSLESFDVSSAKVVEERAFEGCYELTYVEFGKKLDSIGKGAFIMSNLIRIQIPLKNGLFDGGDNVFMGCDKFCEVGLVDEAVIHETIDALLLDEWKDDMNQEVDSINQILSNADAGDSEDNVGDKTRSLRLWISSVLQKIILYKVEHYRLLSLAAAALAEVAPDEVAISNMLSWLQLPDHAFEGEGDNSITTPVFDQHLWKKIVQKEQRLIEMEGDNYMLKMSNDEQADSIQRLEQRIAQLELQVAEAGGASTQKNDVGDISKKRQRCSQAKVEDLMCTHRT